MEKDTSLNTKICNKEVETDVWQDIATALEDWTRQILDTESRRATSENVRQRIEESLRRHQLDRFLTARDLTGLRYIAHFWAESPERDIFLYCGVCICQT